MLTMKHVFHALILALCMLIVSGPTFGKPAGFRELTWRDLENNIVSPHGKAALSIHPEAWRHGETAHFT